MCHTCRASVQSANDLRSKSAAKFPSSFRATSAKFTMQIAEKLLLGCRISKSPNSGNRSRKTSTQRSNCCSCWKDNHPSSQVYRGCAQGVQGMYSDVEGPSVLLLTCVDVVLYCFHLVCFFDPRA